MKVCMLPKASDLGIGRVIEAYRAYLPKFGIQFVDKDDQADLVVTHAGTKASRPAHVAHCHGLYPTATTDQSTLYFNSNAQVVESVRHALEVTVPSPWVAMTFQREMGFSPHIVPHGIDVGRWPFRQGKRGERFILWAKGHNPGVCDSSVVNKLAERLPDWQFVTTFGDKANNVKVTGPLPFNDMWSTIRAADLYLATTKETFGIQTLEAMATGVRLSATPRVSQPHCFAKRVSSSS